jgi:hypothetical protein
MDIYSLRVFNEMHGLGITEQELIAIEKETNNEVTGVANMLNRDGYLIYVNHDDKDNIYLKKTTRDLVCPSRILSKILITFEPPAEIFQLHLIAKYHAQDWAYKTQADNLDELKTKIIDRFIDGYDKTIQTEEQFKALFWLFDKPYEKVTNKTRNDMSTILKVFEKDNRRLAIIRKHDEWITKQMFCYNRERESAEYLAKTYTPKCPEYNYVDEGREFKGNVWIDDELLDKISKEELDIIVSKREDNKKFYLLNSKEYANVCNSIRLQLMTAKRQADNEKKEKTVKTKIEKEYKKKGMLVRQGVTFTPQYISYNDLKLEGPMIAEYIEFNRLILADNCDFNSIAAGYVDYILKRELERNCYGEYTNKVKIGFEHPVSMIIGKVEVNVERHNKNICIKTPVYNRIRNDELHQVILYALRFNTQEEYNAFVEDVSNKSLRLIKLLESGLSFTLKGVKRDDNDLGERGAMFSINLKIIREKNKNYVLVKDKKLQITNIDGLFKLKENGSEYDWRSNYDPVQRAIKILFKCIKGITAPDLSDLIKEGKAGYDLRIKRSNEFIKNAIKLTKARKKANGYIVKGMGDTHYYVGKDTSDRIVVYTWVKNKPDKYICIVDVDSETDEPGLNDCIAKRLLALNKDMVVANEIDTIKAVI